MKISGTDAAVILVDKSQFPDTETTSKGPKDKKNILENMAISQMTEQDRIELPLSEQVVINAIEKANKAFSGANKRFVFSIHEKTKEIMVKVIDSDTNEVIREIPPEKILDMVAKMWEMAGLIVDERR